MSDDLRDLKRRSREAAVRARQRALVLGSMAMANSGNGFAPVARQPQMTSTERRRLHEQMVAAGWEVRPWMREFLLGEDEPT